MQGCAQIVGGAIEGRSHRARLIFQSVEDSIDGHGERVELVVRSRHRQPTTQIARHDLPADRRDVADASREFETEPEAGECGGERRQTYSPERGETEFLGKAPSLRNVRSDEEPVATRQGPHGCAYRVHGTPTGLDRLDLEFGPASRGHALERPLLDVPCDLLVVRIHEHVHGADPPPTVDTQIDLVREPADTAARVLVVEALHLRVDDQIDLVRDQALREQIRTAQCHADGQRDQQRVADGQTESSGLEWVEPHARTRPPCAAVVAAQHGDGEVGFCAHGSLRRM